MKKKVEVEMDLSDVIPVEVMEAIEMKVCDVCEEHNLNIDTVNWYVTNMTAKIVVEGDIEEL